MFRRGFITLSTKGIAALGIAPGLLTRATVRDKNSEDKIEPIVAPFSMPQLQRPVFPDKIFNVEKYGAKGDGITKNTQAFRAAIAECSASAGGYVVVPKGQWFTGAIHLQSNVNLRLEEGAEIHFSEQPEDYMPVVFTRWAGFEVMNYSPLIYAVDCKNIAITGKGKLFGHGQSWWKWKQREDGQDGIGEKIYRQMVLNNVPPKQRIFGNSDEGLRPQLINLVGCCNVLLEGFTIAQPGPFWTIHFYLCENVIARRLDIHTKGGPNTDGIDIDSSRNVLVEHCLVEAEDDTVCLKSGINEDGWRVGRPTENINYTSCDQPAGARRGSYWQRDVWKCP